MTPSDLRARVLDELGRGLALELAIARDADDPLLYVERRAYLTALAEFHSGVEAARVTLVRALQRMGK